MDDRETRALARSAFAVLIERSPDAPDFDDFGRSFASPGRRHLLALPAAAALGAAAMVFIVVVIAVAIASSNPELAAPDVTPAVTTIGQPPDATVVGPETGRAELSLQYGLRKGDTLPYVGVVWSGLPNTAHDVVVTWDGDIDAATPVPVVEGQASFEIRKPEWHRYAEFTAYNEQRSPVAVEVVLVDGGVCSTGSLSPVPVPSNELPAVVDAARRHILDRLFGCRFDDLAELASGPGPYFGVAAPDLAEHLLELDRQRGFLREMRTALRFDAERVTSSGRDEFVFDSAGGIQIVLDSGGVWVRGTPPDDPRVTVRDIDIDPTLVEIGRSVHVAGTVGPTPVDGEPSLTTLYLIAEGTYSLVDVLCRVRVEADGGFSCTATIEEGGQYHAVTPGDYRIAFGDPWNVVQGSSFSVREISP